MQWLPHYLEFMIVRRLLRPAFNFDSGGSTFTPKTPSETLCFGRTKFLNKYAPNLLENITRPENKIWGFAMNF